MSEWQPISTAPKDGTVILVWLANELGSYDFGYWWALDNQCRIMLARFWDGAWYSPGGTGAPGYEGDDYESVATDIVPIFWMPLPTPPHESRGEE